ncbi:MAG TPA: TonB-dependent receptor [Verrucomicrobiae bacterium]
MLREQNLNRLKIAGSTAALVASIMNVGAQTDNATLTINGKVIATTTTNAPSKLTEVIITGTNSPSLTVPDVYAAKAEITRIPGGADVIPADTFLTGRASTMKDVLDWSPGVFVQPRFGSDEARLSIRGSGIQRTFHGRGIKLLMDGIPLNLADGGFDMQGIEPLAVSYVEVLRGANALRYGSTTLGGAINYVMPTGHDTDKIRLRVEAGSYGYLKTHASSGLAEGKNDYYAGYTYSALDGFREHSQQNAHRIFSNVGHKFNDNVETRAYFTYVQTYSELPGNLFKTQLENNPDMALPINVTQDQQRNFELIRAASKTSWKNDTHALDVSVFWSHKDLFHPIFQVVDQNSNDAGLDIRYRNYSDLFSRPNQLTVGFSPTVGRTESANFGNASGAPGALINESTQASYNLDLYAENQHWLTDKFSLITGVQISQSRRDFNDTVGANDFTADYWGVSPKLGAIYDLRSDWQFYGNVSRSFEPPSMSELGGIGGIPVIRDAQSGWTVELGTRGEHGRFSWDLSYYHTWLENELLAYEPSPGAAPVTINASTTVHRGVELKENVRLFENLFTDSDIFCEQDGINWTTAYMWNDFRFQDDGDFSANDLPGVPKHYVRSEVIYSHPKGFYFGPNIEWSPAKYAVDMGNALFADPYMLLGVKAGYRVKKGFSVFVEGRNLTDKNYAATTGVITTTTAPGVSLAQFLPGDGRSFYAGVEWKW